MSLHDFESSCHFYFKNSWNVSILMKLRHRFFLKCDKQILYNYNYVDFPLCIESAGNGSCHWVYMYIPEMPTSGDLKSGYCLFFQCPPPPPPRNFNEPPRTRKIDPALNGNDLGLWCLTWCTYYQNSKSSFWS